MMLALYIVVGVAVLVLVLNLIAPKNYAVSRSIVILRSSPVVFDYLKKLNNQENWSPWAKKDPNMARKYTGKDGTVGYISYWNGNKEVGEGEQEITNIVPNDCIDVQLRFFSPYKSTSNCYFKVAKITEDTTKVTWGFRCKHIFPMTIFMLFINMDKTLGKDFEEGLEALKKVLEN